jgi:hypothetical protein
MNEPITVVDKVTHASITAAVDAHEISLTTRSIVKLPVTRDEVKTFARAGHDLVVTLTDGEVVTIHGYFVDGSDGLQGKNSLVLQSDAAPADGTPVDGAAADGTQPADGASAAGGTPADNGLWLADTDSVENAAAGTVLNATPDSYQAIDSLEPLYINGDTPREALPVIYALAGFATALAAATVFEHSSPSQVSTPTTAAGAEDRVGDGVIDYTGPLKNGQVTDDPAPLFSGTGASGNIVTLYDGNTPIGSTVVDQNGNWSLTPNTPLSGGSTANPTGDSHTITYTYKDPAGDASSESGPSPGLTITVDTTPPTTPGTAPGALDKVGDGVVDYTGPIKNGSTTDDPTPTFSGSGAPSDAVLAVIYDNGTAIGSATVNPDGTWSFVPTTPLSSVNPDGDQHSITYTYSDAAGNQSGDSPALNFGVDTTPPNKPTSAPGGLEIG